MVKYVIRADPGTYAHLESKSSAKMIERVPTRGCNPTVEQAIKLLTIVLSIYEFSVGEFPGRAISA